MTKKKRAAILRSVEGMLFKLSLAAWRRLPRNLRSWIDPEDLYQESRLHACKILEKWNPEKGAVTTFLHCAVKNHLSHVVANLTARKRYAAEAEWVELKTVDKNVRTLDPIIDAAILIIFTRR